MLYQASKGEISILSLKDKCKDISNILLVIKKNASYIYGGFYQYDFILENTRYHPKSLIFELDNYKCPLSDCNYLYNGYSFGSSLIQEIEAYSIEDSKI